MILINFQSICWDLSKELRVINYWTIPGMAGCQKETYRYDKFSSCLIDVAIVLVIFDFLLIRFIMKLGTLS